MKYRIRKNSIADYAIRFAKPLGCLVVASVILAAYSWAAADELKTYTMQAEEYEQVKGEYIANEELASYEQVREPLETLGSEPIEEVKSEPEQINQSVNAEIKQANWESLGDFEITAYCPCSKCCGFWADGVTACGAIAEEGKTIAADTDILPFGTKVKINGEIYTVQDTGGAIKGKRIDIFFDSHQTALDWGRQTIEVFVER